MSTRTMSVLHVAPNHALHLPEVMAANTSCRILRIFTFPCRESDHTSSPKERSPVKTTMYRTNARHNTNAELKWADVAESM